MKIVWVMLVGLAAILFLGPAHTHSVATNSSDQSPIEDYPPEAGIRKVTASIPGVPPQVDTVVDRLKFWKTSTPLAVCFLNGTPDIRAFFVSTARTWLDRGGLRMNFGDSPSYRDCRTIDEHHQRELRRLILHELGHALALEHEHQSPLASCRFDWSKVVPYYQSRYGWDETKIKANLGAFTPRPGLQATTWDSASIMNYGFPSWMFLEQQQGGQRCEILVNYDPSATDLSSYARLYPGQQSDQDRVVAERGVRALAEIQQLVPDETQRKLVADLITKTAQTQFPELKMDIQNGNVTIGQIGQQNIYGAPGGVTGGVITGGTYHLGAPPPPQPSPSQIPK